MDMNGAVAPYLSQQAVAINSVVVQAGRDVIIPAPVPDIAAVPPRADVGRLPVVTGDFVGRSAELELLDAAVFEAERAVVGVHGLGGVGKSTLVARFVRENLGWFPFTWWMTADSPAAIDAGFAELACALAPEAQYLPLVQRTELGVRWLATHSDWLLVLDNLSDPLHLVDLLAKVRTGTVIVTSRRAGGWSVLTGRVDVDVLATEAATDLLTGIVRATRPDADLTGAGRLCEELGRLPLAIEQAGAYIAQNRMTPDAYLGLLARSPARMFTKTGEDGDPQRTMARVWHVTLDRLADTPLAGALLRQLAWYAPDTIPRGLCALAGDETDVLEALGRLETYSMITRRNDTISVHRLVQAVTRTPDPADRHRRPEDIAAARDSATAALAAAVMGRSPKAPADLPVFEAVRPHAEVLFEHTMPDTDNGHTILVLNQLGLYLSDQGKTTLAIDQLARAAASSERLFGISRATMIARNNLATAYTSAGKFSEAITLHEQCLGERVRVLGPDHPDTLTSRNNLAITYQLAGDVRRAIPLYRQTLDDHNRVLGPDHPETLLLQTNLASAYHEVGDLGQAIPLFEAVFAHHERVSGAEHRDTLDACNNLASAYDAAGDTGRAIPLYEATLASLEKLLGADHPDALRLRNNLASAYETIGDFARAIPLFDSALKDRVRVLGPDHPEAIMARNNLAKAHHNADNLDQAIRLYEAALADFERVLGPDNPDTLIVRGNLANAYQDAGDFARAITLNEKTLADRLRRLGPDHPDTLMSRNNLGSAYQNAGNVDQALRLFEAALDDFERVLGPDHPDTLTLRNNLASAYWFTGARDNACLAFDAVYTTRKRVLGPEHPNTLMSQHNLARAHESLGDFERAISLFEATVAAQERVLGPDHSGTLRSRYRLAGALESAGDRERALPLYEAVLRDCQRALGPEHALTTMAQTSLDTARGLSVGSA